MKWILSQMLVAMESRMTAEQLLSSDVVQGWRLLLILAPKTKVKGHILIIVIFNWELLILVADLCPPNVKFLLPFLSCLGPSSSELRPVAIHYLKHWCKIGS